MGVLAHCWLMIECRVIPDGFLKWFYLSFYVHPIFLVFCQIFLWLKLLQTWVLVVVFYLLHIIFRIALLFVNLFKKCVVYIFSFIGFANIDNIESFEDDDENFEVMKICGRNQFVASYSSRCSIMAQVKSFQLHKGDPFHEEANYSIEKEDASSLKDFNGEEQSLPVDEDESTNGFLSSVSSFSSSSTNKSSFRLGVLKYDVDAIFFEDGENSLYDDHRSMHDYSTSFNSSESPMNDSNLKNQLAYVRRSDPEANESYIDVYSNPVSILEREVVTRSPNEEVVDAFHMKYVEQMRWFDVLNHDRTYGISTIMNAEVGDSSPLHGSRDINFFFIPEISWSKKARKRLLRSLESDFELIYVAQSCLSWEALHHQYRKVEALALLSSQKGVFYDDLASEFQNFQVLLERFMEDERSEVKRVWNYVRGRSSLKSLLQVPKISGFFEQEDEEISQEGVHVKEVLKAIEKCIQAFWIFVKTDNKKQPWWRLKSSLWTCPPVEDPRDLKLLADLTTKLQKKELWLKDSQGKQKCWFRRVINPVEESQKKEMLFTMIDMRLISRVLHLSVISTSQLKWCQEKLDNIDFKEGRIIRGSTSGPLFPP